MAKSTLLEIVQEILNDMDSDEVNSINDTIESQQVAQIVKSCYNELISNRNWPHLNKLIQLDSSNNPLLPNYLKIPEDVKQVEFIKYDRSTLSQPKMNMQKLIWKEQDSFLRMVSSRDSLGQNIVVVTDPSGINLIINTNQPPTYWTSFDDSYIITDSFDSEVETTLQKNKTQAFVYQETSWVHSDDAIPNLPSEAFAALIEESKSTAFFYLKQMANQKAEQKAGRQQRWLARKAWTAKGGIKYENYGRKSRR